jgi:hypothetical protein
MERFATAVTLAAIAAVMLLAVIHRETPYRVIAKPLESRIHIGDEDKSAHPPAAPASQAHAHDGASSAAGSG